MCLIGGKVHERKRFTTGQKQRAVSGARKKGLGVRSIDKKTYQTKPGRRPGVDCWATTGRREPFKRSKKKSGEMKDIKTGDANVTSTTFS